MRWLQGAFLVSLCLLLAFGACRRNQPSLVDTNEPPETELWHAPPDSTEYEYLVHLYWRGRDNDGTVANYIWTIQDTLVIGETSWSPADRLRDFRAGRMISRTDSLFSFTAFRDVGGVGVKKNRQAFYIAAIDDNGSIDPTPAAVEFIATIDRLPVIRFNVNTDPTNPAGWHPYQSTGVPGDTVGFMKPFKLSYAGTTTNGNVNAYQYFPLSTIITLPDSRVWTEDLSDTLRCFDNGSGVITGTDPECLTVFPNSLPAGVFRFAARCIDDANAESAVDAGRFTTGVAQIVVNFDPDTRVYELQNTYFKNELPVVEMVDFTDSEPDTVPYRSWLQIRYEAWDDPRDTQLCEPAGINPDRCIDFQLLFERERVGVPGSFAQSGWLPRGGTHDSDSTSATDSNSVNLGSLEYDFYIRGIDENETSDGTPATVHVVGNFEPTLESFQLENVDGTILNPGGTGVIDTITWDWSDTDSTIDINTLEWVKTFTLNIRATGFDHPKDPDGSGVKSWQYLFRDADNRLYALGRAGLTWVPGASLNVLNDVIELTFRYPIPPPPGYLDEIFNNLPTYFGKDLSVSLRGRDTSVDEPNFNQYVFWALVPDDEKANHNGSERQLINSYPAATFGRWTDTETIDFHFRMVR